MSNEIVTAPELAPPVGYAHAVIGAPGGRTVHLGGQTALGPDGAIAGATLVEQFDVAAGNVLAALRAAGGEPEHLVQMLVFVTDVAEYKASLRELDMDLGSAIELEAVTQALLMKSDDHREFYAAWAEGRKPAWSGR